MQRSLRIGVNALYLIPGGVGGTEIYLRSLLQALATVDTNNQYFVFTNLETAEDLIPAQANFHRVPQRIKAVIRPARLSWEQFVLPGYVAKLKLDVLFNPGFTAPFFSSAPNVTVFHDLQHMRHPEYFRFFDLPFWKLFLYWSARRSRLLIAVSEATRSDLVKFYPVVSSKVRVVPHGVADQFFELGRQREAGGLQPFLLCVSTLHPHKNIERLVRAFRFVHHEHPEFRLVIAGMRGFHTARIERTIADCGMDKQVQITGWIPREQLLELYRRAWSFVYPSTFEGFGMPVLEALAAGIPSAVSAIDPIRGIAGSAALHFDPLNEDEMAQTMRCTIGDEALRARLAEAGPRRAANFSWRLAAQQTLRVLESAVTTPRLD